MNRSQPRLSHPASSGSPIGGSLIASKLDISEKTVAKHRAKVFQKMEVDNNAALVFLTKG